MNSTQISDRLATIRSLYPEADTFPIRFQGGQGSVYAVQVQFTGFGRDREIVFYTHRG